MNMEMETGESFVDNETGETPSVPCLNCETGEWEMNCNSNRPLATARKPFKIPKNCLNHCPEPEGYSPPPKEPPRASQFTTAVLFLIPAIIVPAFGVLVSIIEVLIHMWAHKKNRSMKNSNKYYRSPLHAFVSEFCKICIDENAANKITKLQDKRNNRLKKYGIEYVRRVVT